MAGSERGSCSCLRPIFTFFDRSFAEGAARLELAVPRILYSRSICHMLCMDSYESMVLALVFVESG